MVNENEKMDSHVIARQVNIFNLACANYLRRMMDERCIKIERKEVE